MISSPAVHSTCVWTFPCGDLAYDYSTFSHDVVSEGISPSCNLFLTVLLSIYSDFLVRYSLLIHIF